MSRQVLREHGLKRRMVPLEVATLRGFDIVFAPSATLVPSPKGVVYGVLAELTPDEIELLYSQGWLAGYSPEAIIARNKDEQEVAARCYIAAPRAGVTPDPKYRAHVVDAAISYNFPSWYVERLRNK